MYRGTCINLHPNVDFLDIDLILYYLILSMDNKLAIAIKIMEHHCSVIRYINLLVVDIPTLLFE